MRRQPIPPDAVLTTDQLADALGMSVRAVRRSDLPCCYIGARVKRYVWSEVLHALKTRTVPQHTAKGRKRRRAA